MNRQTHIAILDDDHSVRTAISRLLKASEMTTELFANCVELFTFLKHDALDCLILDLQMPGLDGIDVLRCLQQRGQCLPVVMITAHDAAGTRESCMSAGAAAYVRKPIDVEALLDAIALVTNGGTQRH
jgi:FixJ family two-component response regulator